ncbi:MAG: GNAT family N-acetyltransferase [Alphaproteobacteria bacterium]
MGKNDLPVISVHVRAGCFSVRPFFRHEDVIIQSGFPDMAHSLATLEKRIFPIEKYGSDVLSAAKFRYFMTKANAITLVVKYDEILIGYAILIFKKNSDIVRVYALAMDENMRGKGFGMAQKMRISIKTLICA